MQTGKLEICRQELRKRKLCALTLPETLHPPNSVIPPHAHNTASICLTLTGQAVEIIGGARIVTHPGCVLIRAPQAIHANQALALQIYRESKIKDTVASVIVEGLMLEMLGHASRSLTKSPVRAPGLVVTGTRFTPAEYRASSNGVL
jgi:hypothetical protein